MSEPTGITMTLPLVMADFEDNTIVLRVPCDFWDKFEVRNGTVTICGSSAIVEK